MVAERPDPDALLAKVQREEAKTRRGRLKIFFGGAAGVGKTYAMLSEAREKRAEGCDVVAGVVETHGRAETAVMLEGLEVLPPRIAADRLLKRQVLLAPKQVQVADRGVGIRALQHRSFGDS